MQATVTANPPITSDGNQDAQRVYDLRPHMVSLGSHPDRGGVDAQTVPGIVIRQVWVSTRPRPWFADAEAIRDGLRARHIHPLLAMRRTRHGSGLGRWRWVVERTFAWLNQFRRLRVRYDKRADIHEAFLSLGCALICWQSLRKRCLPA